MKKTQIRIWAMMLALVMIVSLFPMTAFAADATVVFTVDTSAYTSGVAAGDEIAVPIKVTTNGGFAGASLKINYTATYLTLKEVATGDMGFSCTPSGNNLTVYSSSDISMTGTLATLKFTVNEAAAGQNVEISVTGRYEEDEDVVNAVQAAVTYSTVPGSVAVKSLNPNVTGYTAALSTSASNNEVVSGGDITAKVAVSHSSDEVFNAGEVKLSYETSKLTPNTTSLDAMVADGTLSSYKIDSGVLTIEDFGADKKMPYTYNIPFTASSVDAETTTNVSLNGAAFIHKDNANESNLIAATKSPESLTVTIKVAMVNVTLTNSADSTDTTTVQTQKGKDYTFAPTDTANYTYSNVTATVNGATVTVTDNTNGTFTIAGADVTGDISITYTKTANSYTVTYDGIGANDITDKPTTATYGEALTVTLPADKAPGTEPGYTYGITAKIGETSVGNYDSTTRKLTISGTEITGNIVITVTKTTVSATDVTVTVSGDSGVSIKGVSGNTTTVAIGTPVTLVLNAETGYTYKVTDGDGNEVTFTNGEYTFNATKSVTFTVVKTLKVDTVAVAEYVKVNNYVVWLVTFDGTLAEGVVPTYDGNIMLWSNRYDAYCWLVIGDTLTVDDAKAKVNAKSGTTTDVDYGMDINGTGVTDAADAQLIWNMYNALYNDFSAVTMAQFLAADQNASSTDNTTWKLNVQDAQVIIAAILAGNATV